ncbi:MAG: HAD family hydrolase [Nitrospirae bacterium]|nr:HAD family hydrolase [Nitrospirota bacterium]
MKKLKGVFFDIGSTLVMGPDISPCKDIAKILDHTEINSDTVKDIIMIRELTSPPDIIKYLVSIVNAEAIARCTHKVKDLWDSQEIAAIEIAGASETVKTLKRTGLLIGLISDIWVPYYKSFKLACPEIVAAVNSTTLSFREGVRKPNPVLYERALASLDLTPDAAVMVGDSYFSDIEPAMKLGMTTVWFLSRPAHELDSIVRVFNNELKKPDFVIGKITELLTLDLWR